MKNVHVRKLNQSGFFFKRWVVHPEEINDSYNIVILSQFFPRKWWAETGIPKVSTADRVHKNSHDRYEDLPNKEPAHRRSDTAVPNVVGSTKPAYQN